MLTALVLAALVAGVAGAWSPCGFSMVDTFAPHGYARRMRMTVVSCAAFAVGALAGGVATFGGLALLGHVLGTGGGAMAAVAVAALLVAAAGDAAGRRIVPQVRRQVPESWRRVLPVPLAAALYGVLLGLGFTTFVLSFAVYALAAACLALGVPSVGVAVGLAFAVGRILPVVVLAPMQSTERGIEIAGAMGDRPGVLRALRATGGVALGAAALALALGGAPAAAAEPKLLSSSGTDPSAGGTALAWQRPGGGASILQRAGAKAMGLPGSDPALGPQTLSLLGRTTWRRCCGSTRRAPRSLRSPSAGSCGARAKAAATYCAPSICSPPTSPQSCCCARAAQIGSVARPSTVIARCCISRPAARARSWRSTCRAERASSCAGRRAVRCCSTRPSSAASCSSFARRWRVRA